ncbi:MAG: hypothetical protein IJ181_10050 [Acidaminococcaceae bacterium]|nr:hypothetical protein [Acidaminococcaceae bacterium]
MSRAKEQQQGNQTAAVSDEQIIAALLSNGTIRAASAACGIAQRTLYDRMKSRDFMAAYTAAKTDLIRSAVVAANSRLSAAIDTVVEIMNNEQNNPATRLQAAQTIINTAGKFAERLRDEEKAITDFAKTPIEAMFDY